MANAYGVTVTNTQKARRQAIDDLLKIAGELYSSLSADLTDDTDDDFGQAGGDIFNARESVQDDLIRLFAEDE